MSISEFGSKLTAIILRTGLWLLILRIVYEANPLFLLKIIKNSYFEINQLRIVTVLFGEFKDTILFIKQSNFKGVGNELEFGVVYVL